MSLDLFETPYFAVIFQAKINKKRADSEYQNMSKKVRSLAETQQGFLGFESAENDKGEISISYWKTKDDIKNWKLNTLHLEAQLKGKESWYDNYLVRVCKVEREYKF